MGILGAPLCRNMDEVHRFAAPDTPASRLITYSSHPQSTCGMGRATDSSGQLLQVEGIYCIDASALPTNVGRNPQISVMTVSRILAERLSERLGGTHKPLVSMLP
jgi:choline dehydrogenase-like flavoprotein